MSTNRRAIAYSTPSFGRRAPRVAPVAGPRGSNRLADDLRLFVLTFAAGFVFMSVYLG